MCHKMDNLHQQDSMYNKLTTQNLILTIESNITIKSEPLPTSAFTILKYEILSLLLLFSNKKR